MFCLSLLCDYLKLQFMKLCNCDLVTIAVDCPLGPTVKTENPVLKCWRCAVREVSTRWRCKPVGESDSPLQLFHAHSRDCSISAFTLHVRAADAYESTCFLLER